MKSMKDHRISQAHKLRAHLLCGEHINRKTQPPDVGKPNDSLHSVVSILRNELYFPVSSNRETDGTFTYFAEKAEINAFYKDRNAQIKKMRVVVRDARIKLGVASVHRMARLFNDPIKLSEGTTATLRIAALQIISKTQ